MSPSTEKDLDEKQSRRVRHSTMPQDVLEGKRAHNAREFANPSLKSTSWDKGVQERQVANTFIPWTELNIGTRPLHGADDMT